MKTLVWCVGTVAAFWALCVFGVGVQRLLAWRERCRWEREIFDPSYVRMIAAFERIQEEVGG